MDACLVSSDRSAGRIAARHAAAQPSQGIRMLNTLGGSLGGVRVGERFRRLAHGSDSAARLNNFGTTVRISVTITPPRLADVRPSDRFGKAQ
jgi:hypothetical protein